MKKNLIIFVFLLMLTSKIIYAQTQCPSLTGVITDGCDNGSTPCDEGQSEIAFFNAGTFSIHVASFQATHTLNYYGSAANFASSTENAYSGSFGTNAALVSSLNSSVGCGAGSFIDAVSVGTIPAGATFIMISSDFCTLNYNLASICASFSPIYVLSFQTSSGNGLWATSGNYANHQTPSPKPKYIAVDFSTVAAGCSEQYYTYDATSESSGNGSGISFPGTTSTSTASPESPNNYTSSGCSLPIVLPVQLLSFEATKTENNSIEIKWATAVEINCSYFLVEYSFDSEKFNTYTQVKGGGNNYGKKDYTSIFTENEGNNNIYFRLKQVDFNGNYKYSNIISVGAYPSDKSNLVVYNNNDKNKIVIRFHLDAPQLVNISLFDITGAKIQETSPITYSKGDNEVLLNAADRAGIYFLVYQNGSNVPIQKKIMVLK